MQTRLKEVILPKFNNGAINFWWKTIRNVYVCFFILLNLNTVLPNEFSLSLFYFLPKSKKKKKKIPKKDQKTQFQPLFKLKSKVIPKSKSQFIVVIN